MWYRTRCNFPKYYTFKKFSANFGDFFFNVDHIVLYYNQVQQYCTSCGVCMGKYFCTTCKFFDDDVSSRVSSLIHWKKMKISLSLHFNFWIKKMKMVPNAPFVGYFLYAGSQSSFLTYTTNLFLFQTSKNQFHCDECGICRLIL